VSKLNEKRNIPQHTSPPPMLPYLVKIHDELFGSSSGDAASASGSSSEKVKMLRGDNNRANSETVHPGSFGEHASPEVSVYQLYSEGNGLVSQPTSSSSLLAGSEKKLKRQRPGSGPKSSSFTNTATDEQLLQKTMSSTTTTNTAKEHHLQPSSREYSTKFNNMMYPTHSQAELRHAAIVIQRIGRGKNARTSIWRVGGVGSLRAAIRIQCFFRQYMARCLLSKRLLARDQLAASLIQGLFRGFKYGRLAAKRRRVEKMSEAASKIQVFFKIIIIIIIES
jgi:hypothetical protein